MWRARRRPRRATDRAGGSTPTCTTRWWPRCASVDRRLRSAGVIGPGLAIALMRTRLACMIEVRAFPPGALFSTPIIGTTTTVGLPLPSTASPSAHRSGLCRRRRGRRISPLPNQTVRACNFPCPAGSHHQTPRKAPGRHKALVVNERLAGTDGDVLRPVVTRPRRARPMTGRARQLRPSHHRGAPHACPHRSRAPTSG